MSLLSSGKVEDKVKREYHTDKDRITTSSKVGRTEPPVSQDDPEGAFHFAQKLLASHQSNISVKSTIEQSATLYTNGKFEHDFKTMFYEISFDTNFTVNVL